MRRHLLDTEKINNWSLLLNDHHQQLNIDKKKKKTNVKADINKISGKRSISNIVINILTLFYTYVLIFPCSKQYYNNYYFKHFS